MDNVDKKYPLDFSKLTYFLYESYGRSDISDIIEKYGSDKLGLFRMLTETDSLMNAGKLRSRIKRIVAKIENPTSGPLETISSESSSSAEEEF